VIFTYLIANVWVINGLVCKVFNLVPRHRAIVARILGQRHARGRTILIGLLEMAMAVWIADYLVKEITGGWLIQFFTDGRPRVFLKVPRQLIR
jgi:hypothetical protein